MFTAYNMDKFVVEKLATGTVHPEQKKHLMQNNFTVNHANGTGSRYGMAAM